MINKLCKTILLVSVSLPLFAQEPDITSSIPTLLFGLVFMIALIYALAIIAKKTNIGQMKTPGMKVVSVLPLTNREKIMLVDVGGTQLLLGVTAQSINLIKELPEPLDLSSPDFKQTFSKILNNKKDNKEIS